MENDIKQVEAGLVEVLRGIIDWQRELIERLIDERQRDDPADWWRDGPQEDQERGG